jgi:hypothetical protein
MDQTTAEDQRPDPLLVDAMFPPNLRNRKPTFFFLGKEIGLADADGGAAGAALVKTGPGKVIVDAREFRSSLPSMLHARGLEV